MHRGRKSSWDCMPDAAIRNLLVTRTQLTTHLAVRENSVNVCSINLAK